VEHDITSLQELPFPKSNISETNTSNLIRPDQS